MEAVHNLLNNIVDVAIMLFEFMGVVVIIASGIRGIISYIRHDPLTRLNLAKGMAKGLEFKLGGEILRTVIARDWNEILIVGAIIALRSALNFLIHWEIRHIQHDDEILHDTVLHDAPKDAAKE